MSDSGDVGQLSEQLAAHGREVLTEQLRGAYANAAQTHADVVSLDQSRIDGLVKRAVENADGLQWRRAIASAASERLGISVVDAISHPAVAKAQELAGGPSYEDSLARALSATAPAQAAPAQPAATAPATDGAAPEADEPSAPVVQENLFGSSASGDSADEPEAGSVDKSYVPAEDEAAAQFTEDEVAQANAPTQTYEAATAGSAAPDADDSDSGSSEETADEVASDEDEEPAAPSPLTGLAKAKPVIDPYATQVHDMAAEFAAQDRGAETPGSGTKPATEADVPPATSAARKPQTAARPVAPAAPMPPAQPAADPDDDSDREATAVRGPARDEAPMPPRRPGAPARPAPQRAPEPAPYPDDDYDDELRVAAVHLGGVANLPSRGEPLDVRISEAGLDILQANEEILGRLQWTDIDRLEVSGPKGRLFGGNKGGSRLVVRTQHGDASFEIPDMDPEDLRAEVAELSARYGR